MPQEAKDLREQLAPLRAKLRENLAVIRPVSQVVVRLKPEGKQDRFAKTIDDILRWMNNRAGRHLPDTAWKRQSFELSDIGAQRTAGIALTDPQYWAARLDDADKTVPLRTWVTEIGVGVDANQDVLFGTRLICATRGEDVPFDRTIPGFVRAVLTDGPAELDGDLVRALPRLISTEEDIDWLVQLLERPSRASDVVVISLPDRSVDPSQAVISTENVSRQVMGAAHVVVVTGAASFSLTDRIGKELSVFRQGVRTYKPGFRSWVDEPSRHPLALAQRIAVWNQEGPNAFERWLVNHTLGNSVYVTDREQRLPGFNTIRQVSARMEREKHRQSGASDTEMLRLYQEDNDQLRNELKEQKEQLDGLLEDADREREAAQNEANTAKAQLFTLRNRIRSLEEQIASAGNRAQLAIPETLENFENWCSEHLAGSIYMVNRAYQGVRKSEYHDPPMLYKALLVLRDYYVPMRRYGSADLRHAYDAALDDLALEETPTGEGVRFDLELYSAQYGGGRRTMDRHLKGGNSRQPRFCFRLYFFWDDEAEVAVVGWLPSHLDSRLT